MYGFTTQTKQLLDIDVEDETDALVLAEHFTDDEILENKELKIQGSSFQPDVIL